MAVNWIGETITLSSINKKRERSLLVPFFIHYKHTYISSNFLFNNMVKRFQNHENYQKHNNKHEAR